MKSKHPRKGGENKTERDGRDHFLDIRKEVNNDGVSEGKRRSATSTSAGAR